MGWGSHRQAAGSCEGKADVPGMPVMAMELRHPAPHVSPICAPWCLSHGIVAGGWGPGIHGSFPDPDETVRKGGFIPCTAPHKQKPARQGHWEGPGQPGRPMTQERLREGAQEPKGLN